MSIRVKLLLFIMTITIYGCNYKLFVHESQYINKENGFIIKVKSLYYFVPVSVDSIDIINISDSIQLIDVLLKKKKKIALQLPLSIEETQKLSFIELFKNSPYDSYCPVYLEYVIEDREELSLNNRKVRCLEIDVLFSIENMRYMRLKYFYPNLTILELKVLRSPH